MKHLRKSTWLTGLTLALSMSLGVQAQEAAPKETVG